MQCHSRASKCIQRALFKGQCICDVGTAGNGRSVCDGMDRGSVCVSSLRDESPVPLHYDRLRINLRSGESSYHRRRQRIRSSLAFRSSHSSALQKFDYPQGEILHSRHTSLPLSSVHVFVFVQISSSWICGGTLINHRTILTAVCCHPMSNDDGSFSFLGSLFENCR